MARDTSVLPDGQARYDKMKEKLGEAGADAWFDKTVGVLGLAPGTPVAPIQPVTVSPVPTPTAMLAATGGGEMKPKPTALDLIPEEQKALEAATKRYTDAGIPTREKVKQDIQLKLAAEGLSPFGAGAAAFNKRLVEEMNKSDFAEKRAQEDVAPARRPLVTGFDRGAPIVGESTLSKSPQQVAGMGAIEALGAAIRPQVLETPEETAARLTAERQQKEIDKLDATARKSFFSNLQEDFLAEANTQFPLYDEDQRKAEARKNYLSFLQSNLPDEYTAELRRPEETAAFGIPGSQSSGVSAGKADVADATGIAVSFLSSDKYDPEVYKKMKQAAGITPDTEAVVESLPMTTLRDLGGILRFAVNPAMDVVMYDVEPGTDTKINPDEWGFVPRERTGGKEARAFGKSYIAPKDSGISGKVKEIAVEIASGRTLGDDLAAQQAVRPEDEMAYRGIGMLAELALPINPFDVVGAVGSAGKAAGVTSITKAAGGVKALETAATEFVPAATNWWQVEKNLIAPLQKAGAEGKILGDEMNKSSKLKKWLVDSNSMAAQQATAVSDDLISLRQVQEGLTPSSPRVAAIVNAPNVVDKQKLAEKLLNNLATAPENTVTKTAAQMAQKIPASELGKEAARIQLANAAKQGLSQTTLGQWSFATPRIVTTTKWAEKNLPEVYDTAKNTYGSLINVTTDAAGVRTVIAKQDLGSPMWQSFINDYAKVSRPITGGLENAEISRIFNGVKAGDKLNAEQWATLQRIVDDGAVLIVSKTIGGPGEGAAIALTQTGRAYQSALVPKEMQTALGTGKQLLSNVAPKWFMEPDIAPLAVQQLKNDYLGYLKNVDSQYAATVSGLAKQKLSPEQIWGQLVARSISSDPKYAQYGAFAADTTKLNTLENGRDAAKSVLGLYFGEASSLKGLAETPRGRQIINEVDLLLQDPNVSLLNPDTFMSEVESLAGRIEQKVPELGRNKATNLTDVVLAYVNEQSKNRALAGFYKQRASELASTTFTTKLEQVGLSSAEQAKIKSYDDAVARLQSDMKAESDRVNSVLDQIKLQPVSQQQSIKNELLKKYKQFRIDNEKAIEGIQIERDKFAASMQDPVAKLVTTQKPYVDALTDGLQKSLSNQDFSNVLRDTLKKAEYSDEQIQVIQQKLGGKFVSDINNFHMDVLRSTGGLPISPSEAMTRLNLNIKKVGDRIQMMPVNLQNDVKQLQSIMSKADQRDIGKFALTVTEIERQQPGLTAKLMQDVFGPTVEYTYKSMIEGMLAGRTLPNYTYLSENVVTAPLIAAVTNPTYIDNVVSSAMSIAPKSLAGATGVGDFGKYHGYAYNIFENARNAPDAIAFTTAAGKKITNNELLDMWRRANIGSSNAAVTIGPDVTRELKALAERETKGAPATVKKIARDIIPSPTMSIPSTSAANADMAFRMSLFKEALRRGATEEQATRIARDTLLDFGTLNKIVPDELKGLKRGVLFLSFQAAMSAAILKAMARGETAENVLRMARYHKDLAQWYSNEYADQPQLESMWLGSIKDVGGKPTQMTYLRDPIMGQLFTAVGLADQAANFINAPTDSAMNVVESIGFNPSLQLLIDLKDARANQSIPPRQIAFLQATGLWDEAVGQLNIKERKPEEMRIGEPTFDGRQYTMNSEADAKKYVAFMYSLTALGWNRMLNDWTNAAVAAGIAPEGAYMARYTPGNNEFEGVQSEGKLLNGALYFLARGRAYRVPTAIEEQDRQIQAELKRLKDIQ